jgi:hypothetical protein
MKYPRKFGQVPEVSDSSRGLVFFIDTVWIVGPLGQAINLYVLTVLLSIPFNKLPWHKVILSWPRGLNQEKTRQHKGNPILADSVDDLPCAPDDKG